MSELSLTIAKVILLKCWSISNKLPSLHQLLYADNNDIIAVTETWLKQQYTNGLIDPDGHYHVIRCDSEGKADGGVCLLVKRNINISNVDIVTGVEMVCVYIVADNRQ